jgi:hypothetical protein
MLEKDSTLKKYLKMFGGLVACIALGGVIVGIREYNKHSSAAPVPSVSTTK